MMAVGRESVARAPKHAGTAAPAQTPAGAVAQSALRTLERERAGLSALLDALAGSLAGPFAAAVGLISSAVDRRPEEAAGGRVIVTGVGKSGHIGRKIAATLASTGTPAFFVHAAEAGHGDLGMIGREDLILATSWSGESGELRTIVEYSRRFRIPLVALTGNPDGALAASADVVLVLPPAAEACPHGLAPTTSTLMQLAIGDALAIALLEHRGFTVQQFRDFHPGGKLGAGLHLVRDIMHSGAAMPLASVATPMSDAIVTISAKGFGCLGVVDGVGQLAGIITDGDLRRHMGPQLLGRTAGEIMTASPKTAGPETLAAEALAMMNFAERPFTVLFVVEDGRPVGIVHMHDLLRLGVA